ncbi:MAG TPA: FtsW/RodA/SpoVE family cell cycle protein [Thermoanaerobaculia bacterium]|nr:FtsW/RodA/SpoVE family cell cycle protein [Thermoanaerobaculia bacterium]
MGITISRAAERRSHATPGSGQAGLLGEPWRGHRGREALLLALSGSVVALAMVLTWLTVSRPLGDVEARLARGEVVNLNAVASPGDLLPLLAFLPSAEERGFVADRIRQRLAAAPVGNVGELGRLRVAAAEVDPRRQPGLAARLAASGKDTVALLSPAELRELKPMLVVRTASQYRWSFRLAAALLLGGFLAAHLVLRRRRFQGDELLLPVLLLFCGLGFVLMASLRDPLRDLPLHARFAEGVLAGCCLFVAGALIDLERTALPRRGAWTLALAALLSALLIVFGGGPGVSDAKVNFLGFQPVELIKILIALFLAGYFADRWELLREVHERRVPLGRAGRLLPLPRLEYVVPPAVAVGLVLFFFFLQKDLGPALVLASLFLILFSVARGRGGMPLVGAGMVTLAFFAGYKLGYPRTVGQRIGMWLAPWDTWFRGGDHLAQAIWSLAAGGATGTGLGLGEPGLVPEAHTDMVLSAIGEQLGFFGLLAVAGLYALLVQRGLRAARLSGSAYGFFLGLGFTLLLALETTLISGGVLGLLPLSGVTSPFLSFGRSALLANFLVAGVLAGISSRRGAPEAVRPFLGGARWTAAGLGLFLVLALARLADLQLLRADGYLTRGAVVLQGDGVRRVQYNQRLAAIAATIPRGSIVDRGGVLLASSDPAEIDRQRGELEQLGAAASDLAGATPDRRVRVYPFGGRTFHLLGDLRSRIHWTARNTSFVERDARIRLQGYDDYAGVIRVRQPDKTETPQVVVDYRDLVPLLRHRYEPERPEVKAILARDRTVRLTVDVRLELAAEEILARHAAQAGFGAAAVVLDAATGDLLAAASYPWPEQLPAADPAAALRTQGGLGAGTGEASGSTGNGGGGGALVDRARYGIYPPGSTFKVVTALAALRKDPGLATRTFECKLLPEGRTGNRVRGRLVRDDPTVTTPHGTVDLDKGIRHSCNAYFAQLATYAVGAEPLLRTAQLFGIPVARPNTPPALADALPQAAYGQGQVIATPLQMARVAATVADQGTMPEVRWIQAEQGARPAAAKAATPAGLPVLDAAATAIIARAMRGVVTEGTAAAFLAGVQPPMAGKTGTAEVQDKKSHSWFIGFAPYGAASRRIAVAVIVEHGGYGGRLAAPAAGEIVRRAAALGLLKDNGNGGTAR